MRRPISPEFTVEETLRIAQFHHLWRHFNARSDIPPAPFRQPCYLAPKTSVWMREAGIKKRGHRLAINALLHGFVDCIVEAANAPIKNERPIKKFLRCRGGRPRKKISP